MSRSEPAARVLDERTVQVWLCRPDEIDDADLLARMERLLTREEHARRARYRMERTRLLFLTARALVRTTLSRHADVPPEDWEFVTGEHGKPSIAPRFASRLRFNLSHTRGMVGCAVRLDEEVGLDVETSDRHNAIERLADRYFSPSEVAEMRGLPAAEQRARFFTYWSLKESYIKARGLGLAIPLDAFSFHLPASEPERIGISFDLAQRDGAGLAGEPTLTGGPLRWQFHHRWATPVHSLAVAAAREGDDLEIDVLETATGIAGEES